MTRQTVPCYRLGMTATMCIKVEEVRVGDVISFSRARVVRVRVAKRVSILQEGWRGSVTFKIGEHITVEREN